MIPVLDERGQGEEKMMKLQVSFSMISYPLQKEFLLGKKVYVDSFPTEKRLILKRARAKDLDE